MGKYKVTTGEGEVEVVADNVRDSENGDWVDFVKYEMVAPPGQGGKTELVIVRRLMASSVHEVERIA